MDAEALLDQLNGSNESDLLEQRRRTTGMQKMKEQLKEEEKKNEKGWNKTLWVLYVCLIVFVGVMGFIRLVGLFRRVTWRNKLDGEFPDGCPDWAAHGCTRVVLKESGCVRTSEIEG